MKNQKNSRRRVSLLVAAALVLIALIVFWVFLRPAGDPAARVKKLWAAAGVEKPNVVLVTMDTTRADHIGCYGYPGAKTPTLDAIARRGVVFEQAATATPLTLPAHCSIMTGLYPTYHGVRVNGNTSLGDDQTTLAEVFAARGYKTGAFIAAFVLDGRWGLNQGFGHYDDQFDLKKYKHLDLGEVQRPGNEVMDDALAWLDGQKAGPFFAWIHLYDPHSPYDPPEPYHSEFAGRGLPGLYDGEIAFMDEQIGRCVSWLAKNGLDRKTIMVLIGDHGEGLGSHGEGTHGYFIYDYALHVPFLAEVPFADMRGRRVSTQVKSVDVFPTVLDLAGIPVPAKVQGRSLVGDMFGRPAPKTESAYAESMTANIQYGWSPLRALRTTRYKYIDAPKAELYDLARDADEQTNVLAEHPDIARRMKTELERVVTETSRGAPAPQAANLDKDTLERLAALGYVGAPVSARKARAGEGALADPKDKLPVFAAVSRAGELILNEKYEEAVSSLESALREEPSIPQALLLLSTCYIRLGRPADAKAKLDLILKDDPESIQGLITMAHVLVEEGKTDDVIALCKRTLSVDDKNTQAYALIGEVYMGQENYSEALPYLEKSVEIQPKMTRNRLNLAACFVKLRQFDRAEPELEEILKESPKFPLARFNLGLLYEEQGKPEAARSAYAEEIAAYPKEYKARFNLGTLLYKLGDKEGALEQMRQVVALAPELAEGHLFLGRSLLHEAVPLDAVQAEVEKGLTLAKTSELKALGYFLLADIYNRRDDPARMNEALRKANAFKSK